MFQEDLYGVKHKWLFHYSTMSSKVNDQASWPDLLDGTRKLIGLAKNLVFEAQYSAHVHDWLTLLNSIVEEVYSLELASPMWRIPKADINSAPYDYAFELARDLLHLLNLLNQLDLVGDPSRFPRKMGDLLSTYRSTNDYEPTLLHMLWIEDVMANGNIQSLRVANQALSEACQKMGRHDRAAVISSRVFWYSLGKRNFETAWSSAKVVFLHRMPMAIVKEAVKGIRKRVEIKRLSSLVGNSSTNRVVASELRARIVNLITLVSMKD